MSDALRFAIIGCGKIAPRHAAEAVKQGQLVAVCDIIKEKADTLANQFSAKRNRPGRYLHSQWTSCHTFHSIIKSGLSCAV